MKFFRFKLSSRSKNVQNGLTGSKIPKMGQKVQKGPKRSKRFKKVQNDPKGPNCSKIGSKMAKFWARDFHWICPKMSDFLVGKWSDVSTQRLKWVRGWVRFFLFKRERKSTLLKNDDEISSERRCAHKVELSPFGGGEGADAGWSRVALLLLLGSRWRATAMLAVEARYDASAFFLSAQHKRRLERYMYYVLIDLNMWRAQGRLRLMWGCKGGELS